MIINTIKITYRFENYRLSTATTSLGRRIWKIGLHENNNMLVFMYFNIFIENRKTVRKKNA